MAQSADLEQRSAAVHFAVFSSPYSLLRERAVMEEPQKSLLSTDLPSGSTLANVQSSTFELPSFKSASSLLFVDAGVQEVQTLLQGLAPGTEVYALNPTQDAIAQITNVLLGRSGISSIQILSHGQAGSLQLGQTWLTADSLSQYAGQFETWKSALTDTADILLYGCNIAAGAQGAAFVQQFSQLTGADIAASTDLTGSTALGGNWTLEYHTGSVETADVFAPTAEAAYQQVLATFSVLNTADSGADSLRQAILDANASAGADVITFTGSTFTDLVPDTIALAADLPDITDSLTIQGTGADLLTISGNNTFRVFNINGSTGTVVAFDKLTIANGKTLSDGGGIENTSAAAVQVSNSVFANNAAGFGGAIDSFNSTGGGLTITNTTFINNQASSSGGAVWSNNPLTITNSTFDGNQTNSGGGAIRIGGGTATLTNLTITGNTADSDSDGNGDGGGISEIAGSTTISNSIIVGNVDASGGANPVHPDVSGSVTDGGNNLIGNVVGSTGFTNGVNHTTVGISLADILLAPLGNYGSAIPTHALLPGSPAINTGGATATPTDARNIAAFGTRDIGAFESQGFFITATGGSAQTTDIGTAFVNPLTVQVSSTFNEPVQNGVVTLTASAAGASATLSTTSAVLDAAGKGSVTATANNLTGNYLVSASITALPGAVGFNLTNQLPPPTVIDILDSSPFNVTRLNQPISYTITFSEDIDAATVSAADFANAGTATITIGTILETTPGVFTLEVTPTTLGSVQLRIPTGATIASAISGRNLVVVPPIDDNEIVIVDAVPPTLVSIDDGSAKKIVKPGTVFTYTLTFFDGDTDAASLDAADFSNAGTAAITIGAITKVSPTVFTVKVTPTSDGTLQLQIPVGANITDLAGNPLVTPVLDNDTLQVDGTPPQILSIDDGTIENRLPFGSKLTYTIAFNEDIDATTFTLADLANGGTAAISLSNLTETTPTSGIFTVDVTPTSVGTVQLTIPTGAIIADLAGNGLVTPVFASDIVKVYDSPKILNFGSAFSYVENDPPTLITPAATVTDLDTPIFNTGTLSVAFTAGAVPEDLLSVRNQGTAVGQVGIAGNTVTYNFGAGAVAIASLTGGTNGTSLAILFNANATRAAVEAVLRNLTYFNNSDNPTTSPRTVQVLLTDGDSGISTPATKAIAVVAVNDAPVLLDTNLNLNPVNKNAGTPLKAVGTLVSALVSLGDNVTDADSTATGIAITQLDTSQGVWWYSLNNGASWTTVGSVSANNALLLAADSNTRLYFQSTSGVLGNLANAVTFRAWDQTSGANGSKANTTPNGTPTAFSLATETAAIAVVSNSELMDFDKDGRPDILWRNPLTGETLIRGSKSNFQAGYSFPIANSDWTVVEVADFDRDGNLDILWRNETEGRLGIWKLNGLNFVEAISLPNASADWKIVSVADFDRDGNLDLMWHNERDGRVGVWRMKDMAFLEAISVGTATPDWRIEAVTDVDGDGALDILWRNESESRVGFWKLNGINFVNAIGLPTLDANWNLQTMADFNRDGTLDLVWRNETTGQVDLWTLNGSSQAQIFTLGYANKNWAVKGTVDFDGDGYLDMLWRNDLEEQVGIWTLGGTSITNIISLGKIEKTWHVEAVMDLTADDKPDIIWRNDAEGRAGYWQMNGTAFVAAYSIPPAGKGWEIVAPLA